MKKSLILFAAFLLVLGFSGIGNAVSFDFSSSPDGDLVPTSPVPGAIVETFNSAPPTLWTWTGSFGIVSGDLVNQYSAPWSPYIPGKEPTPYVTVPIPSVLSNSVEVTDLGGSYNYFGIFWGSMDGYNTIEFYNDDLLVASILGSDVADPNANGDQFFGGTNRYVNFYFGADTFNNFKMISTGFAFEADNIALANVKVPEPSTMLLLGLGLVFLGGFGRKKFK